jgi:hypothetical protein
MWRNQRNKETYRNTKREGDIEKLCLFVCVCVCVRERERKRESETVRAREKVRKYEKET